MDGKEGVEIAWGCAGKSERAVWKDRSPWKSRVDGLETVGNSLGEALLGGSELQRGRKGNRRN